MYTVFLCLFHHLTCCSRRASCERLFLHFRPLVEFSRRYAYLYAYTNIILLSSLAVCVPDNSTWVPLSRVLGGYSRHVIIIRHLHCDRDIRSKVLYAYNQSFILSCRTWTRHPKAQSKPFRVPTQHFKLIRASKPIPASRTPAHLCMPHDL